MEKYLMRSILSTIQEDFTVIYRNAAGFTDTSLFHQCMDVIGSISDLRKIVAENDKGIPPVQTLLGLMEKHSSQATEITDSESRCMGELMAFVFKYVFQYKNQKDNVPIDNNFGVKTAALYYDGKEFEIAEE